MEMYVGKCRKCGTIHAACVDRPEFAKDTASDIAEWIKRGDIIEHISQDKGVAVNNCACKDRM